MKRFLLLAIFLIAWPVALSAAPVPPSKGQWGFALEESLPLYEKADINADSEYVDFSGEWFSVPSAVRDEDNNLWYKVNINGKSGWLAQNGVRLKMGGKSKTAANFYKTFLKKQSVLQSLMGLTQDQIRKKFGTPTMRETPYDDSDVNILSYELAGQKKSITFSITLRNNIVEGAEFHM
ncbi:MAG: hypothetical protein IJR94_05760 [Synergistaceae bacterium]|nr:hypothetical protein [Synergistaceae bacterium]